MEDWPGVRWLVALLFAWVGGYAVVGASKRAMDGWLRLPPKEPLPGNVRRLPPALTGVIERTFFTVALGMGGSGAVGEIVAAMVGWIGIKLAANWNREGASRLDHARGFVAILAGAISMIVSLIAGAIAW